MLIVILKLVNDKGLMGEYVNNRTFNIIAWTGCGLIILVTVIMLGTMFFG